MKLIDMLRVFFVGVKKENPTDHGRNIGYGTKPLKEYGTRNRNVMQIIREPG